MFHYFGIVEAQRGLLWQRPLMRLQCRRGTVLPTHTPCWSKQASQVTPKEFAATLPDHSPHACTSVGPVVAAQDLSKGYEVEQSK